MRTWQAQARLTWVSVLLAALTSLCLAFGAGPVHLPIALAQWLTATFLLVASMVLALHPLEPAPDRKLNAASAPILALALLFDPAPAALAAGGAAAAGYGLAGLPWYAVLFNTGVRVLSTLAAGSAVRLVTSSAPWALTGAGVMGAAAYLLVNTGCVAAISSARRERPFATTWWEILRGEWSGEVGLLAGGAMLAELIRYAPAAVPLTIPPLWLAWRTLTSATEIKRLNQRLNATLGRQQRFLADASHELRTPIASLRAQLDVARESLRQVDGAASAALVRGRVSPLLDEMANETRRAANLLSDLLALAQADEGARLAQDPVDLEELLLAVYRETRPLAGNVELRLDFDGATDGVALLGDLERLRQLFTNLVTNALRYTPAGGSVVLALHVEGASAHVDVIDTGRGIPAADVPHIFYRFYRVESSRERENDARGGAGLGLSIAKWVAEAHGGSIAVQSALGIGSTFTVRLPLRPATAPHAQRARAGKVPDETSVPAAAAAAAAASPLLDASAAGASLATGASPIDVARGASAAAR